MKTKRHGHTSDSGKIMSPTYITWLSMRQRCLNDKHIRFARYGGRGITVCDEWSKFDHFLADMGIRPEGMSLDRIDNEKSYCKENCRWATKKEQQNNMSRCLKIKDLDGIEITPEEFANKYNVSIENVYSRHRIGKRGEDLIYKNIIIKGVKYYLVGFDSIKEISEKMGIGISTIYWRLEQGKEIKGLEKQVLDE